LKTLKTKDMNEKQAKKRISKIKIETEKLNREAAELQEIIDSKANVMLRIKTFADACIECGSTEKEFNDKYLNIGLREDTINYERIVIIIRALNEGWTPNWSNTNERKWYPYFNAASFGFDGTDCDGWASTTAGSRLCLKSQELAEYAGTQFTDIYKAFMIID